MADAETVMGLTGIIYVCAECGEPVESEPCREHQPIAIIASVLSTARVGARCKVSGFTDWTCTEFNGWQQDGTGWQVSHEFLADLLEGAGYRLNAYCSECGGTPGDHRYVEGEPCRLSPESHDSETGADRG